MGCPPVPVSPGERLWLLLRDVLTGNTPWCRVAERLTLTDREILMGAGRRPADFTDDRLGRARHPEGSA
jgi:hypothetical protein